MKIDVRARRASRIGTTGGVVEPRASAYESLMVAQYEPARAAATAAGMRYLGGTNIIANGIAPVTAIPTTTATLALYNGEPTGGKSLVIERLGFWLGSGTPTAGATLMVCVSPAAIATAPTAMATGYTVSSASGAPNRSNAVFTTAVTVPVLPSAPAWMQVISTFQLAAANVGQGDQVSDLEGCIIVPPKSALGIAILSGTGTTPLYGVSVMWSEFQFDLE